MITPTARTLGPVSEAAHVGESEAASVHRLARQAHESGAQLIVEETNAHYVTSVSRPGERHFVTLLSCDCVGFLRWGRCLHLALVLEAYHALPPLDPPPSGVGVALGVPSIDQHNAAAAARYLDGPRGQAETFALFSDLRGEPYHRACGMTASALAAYCETIADEPSPALVCSSPSCVGRGYFQSHPEDDRVRCDICNGRGIVPGPAVNVAVFAAEVAIAA